MPDTSLIIAQIIRTIASCNDLSCFPASLTIPVLNMLLNELLCVSKVPAGVKHVDLDLSTLPPTTAMAVVIYNRW